MRPAPPHTARLSLASLALLGWAILPCAHAQPQSTSCPWITEATAASILAGAPETVDSEASSTAPAACTFRQTTRSGTRTLIITVETTSTAASRFSALTAACQTPTALTGIGNGAVSCPQHRDAASAEKVVGRVRNQVFTILLTTTLKPDPVLTTAELKARARTAAEQVSGNLF